MDEKAYPDLWYATKHRAEGKDRFWAYDDIGTLSVSKEKIRFAGKKNSFEIKKGDARDISLVELDYPIKTMIKRFLFSAIFFIPLALIALLVGLIFAFFLKNILAVPICLTPVAILFLASFVFGVAIGKRMKWIRITYETEGGVSDSAYLFDGSMFGYGGLLGGSKKAFEVIKRFSLT